RRGIAAVVMAAGVLFMVVLGGAGLWLNRRGGSRGEAGLSVLLITVDTLRADAVGAYGKAEAGTPWMDRLGAAGGRFEDAHAHNAPAATFATPFRSAPYQGEVAASDAALGPLLQPMLDITSKGRTLVVLTADHGESLGEHGEATHGIFAYEATLRVPLILYQ